MGLALLAAILLLSPRASSAVELTPAGRVELERLTTSTRSYVMHSPELGWTVRPSARVGNYRSNLHGLRGPRDYAALPATGTLRVAAFGDSFVHGDDVADDETWEAAVTTLDARIEVLNYGVPAYGLDQAFLRYRREGARLRPSVVLMGVMTHSMHRNVTTFRPYWNAAAGMPFAKPRFILEGKRLVLIPNPLPSLDDYRKMLSDPRAEFPALGAHDSYFQHAAGGQGRMPASAEGFEVAVGLLAAFHAEARRNGQTPLILVFPESQDLRQRRDGDAPYGSLLQALRESGLDYLDCGDALLAADAPVSSLYGPTNHLSAEGNRVVARALAARLRRARP